MTDSRGPIVAVEAADLERSGVGTELLGGQQMYVTGADAVVLLAEPDAWYVSRDGAVSWQRFAYVEGVPPPDYPAGDGGRFYVDDSGAIRDSSSPPTARTPGSWPIPSRSNGRAARRGREAPCSKRPAFP